MSKQIKLPPYLARDLAKLGIQTRDLVLYINSKCNLRCSHCYVGNELLSTSTSYSTEDLCQFLRDLGALSRVTIIGGEPLLHVGINKIIKTAADAPTENLRITTNLTNFFRFNRHAFQDTYLTIVVSLEGHTPGLHDQIRGQGSFERTVSNIRTIVADGFDVEVTHTLNRRNIGEFSCFLRFCKDIGVAKLNLHRMSLHGNAKQLQDIQLSPGEWVQFRKKLTEMTASGGSSAKLKVRFPLLFATWQEYRSMLNTGEYWHQPKRSYYSGGSGGRVVIYCDGKIYISSEFFGTNAYVAKIVDGKLYANISASNELYYFSEEKEDLLTKDLNPDIQGDKDYPVTLSFSYKKSVLV